MNPFAAPLLDVVFIRFAGDTPYEPTIPPPPPELVLSGSGPDGVVGVPWSATYSAAGGVPPYTYSVTGGTVPVGATMNSATGELSTADPTTDATYTFNIGVMDSMGTTDSISDTVVIDPIPPPTWATWDITKTPNLVSGVALSNGDLTVTSPVGWVTGAATVGKSSGTGSFKTVPSGMSGNVFLGLVGNIDPLHWPSPPGIGWPNGNGYLGQDAASECQHRIGYWSNGIIYQRFGATASFTFVASYTPGTDVIEIDVDLNSTPQTAKFYKNGTLQATIDLPSGATWWPAWSSNPAVINANFGQVAFTPAGGGGYAMGWA